MGVAATFAILAALFFWFPKLFGRRLNEPLGKVHFWLTIAGVYCVFMPMHWLGLITHTSAGELAASTPVASPLKNVITFAIVVTVGAQLIFVFNFLWTLLRRGNVEFDNPWRATTLEWAPASAANSPAADEPIVYRGAYQFCPPVHGEDFTPQWIEHGPAELAHGGTSSCSKEPKPHLNKQKAK
jgi:cytochrome c oxidase subunit 1